MIRLSAFADEISADFQEQVAVLKSEQIRFLDLRSVWGKNVLDLSDTELTEVKRLLDANGLQVAALASPIGKVPIDAPFEEHMQRFERALVYAHKLQTRYIRLFSFYPSASREPDPSDSSYREEVIRRLHLFTRRALEAGIVLLHENEKGIYGDGIERNVDLLQSINNPSFRAAFDPANYLQCQQMPYPDAYTAIRPWLEYVHVKDVRSDGILVPAGEGEGRWLEILNQLRSDGYDGFIALEPHLKASGQFQGFSGPDLFCRASQALQAMLRAMKWKYL